MKYHTTNGIAALIGLNTDDLQKTSAYMTEAYLLARANPPIPPFQYAFGTDVPWFPWLEGEGAKQGALSAPPPLSSPARVTSAAPGLPAPKVKPAAVNGHVKGKKSNDVSAEDVQAANPNRYRLERFGAAMQGTGSWEMPGAILLGFDWRALPRGSVIVDVGGGIGSTSMLLANAFSRPGDDQDMGLRFVIQDRPVVVEMGEKAWRTKYPELLDSDTARFQAHDFFDPQPIKNAAVFLLRVVLHDWADAQARKILERLRKAATENTKLLMADFVLPLACPDNVEASEDGGENILDGVEGAEKTLAAPPLLANLGKASSHAYWMDMTMQTVFDAQERTLREIVALARSAGWKVVKVTRAEGSLFGHIVAVPARLDSDAAPVLNGISTQEAQVAPTVNGLSEHLMSRVGTPTFGSRLDLPSVQESRLAKLKSKVVGFMNRGRSNSVLGTARQSAGSPMTSTKKKPSPLSFPPSSLSDKPPTSPRRSQASSVTKAPPSPLSPKHLPSQSMSGAIPTSSSSPIPNSSQTELPAQPTTPVRRSMKEAPSSPRHSKHPSVSSLSRRLSLSKQQPEGLRRRSGSGFGASINGVANFLSSRRSGILNFGESGNKGRESPSGNELPNLPNRNGQTTVLAEAAQIDIGVPVTVAPPSP